MQMHSGWHMNLGADVPARTVGHDHHLLPRPSADRRGKLHRSRVMPMTRKATLLVPATLPLWLKPFSTFGLFSMTMFIERSPVFAIPPILGPSPPWC